MSKLKNVACNVCKEYRASIICLECQNPICLNCIEAGTEKFEANGYYEWNRTIYQCIECIDVLEKEENEKERENEKEPPLLSLCRTLCICLNRRRSKND